MRKSLVILLVAVLASVAVDTLRDRTQNRADEAVAGSVSVVTFDVDTQRAPQPIAESARALWYACNQTVANQLIVLRIGDDQDHERFAHLLTSRWVVVAGRSGPRRRGTRARGEPARRGPCSARWCCLSDW